MKKIHELLKQRLSAGDIGIEIETEGKGLRAIDDGIWRTEDDGSLRGRFPSERSEYVLVRPVPVKNVEHVLDVLRKYQAGAELNFSHRCSVHVHVNIQELTLPELLAYIYLSLLLEEPLMSLCDEARRGNRFCLRLNDAEGYVEYLEYIFKDGLRNVAAINAGAIRYAAINIAPITKYGSIEFRGMHGTMDDKILVPWIQTLYRLREMAKKFGDPVAVHDEFIKQPNDKFVKKMLGVNARHFNYKGCLEDVNRSFSLSINLPHLYLGLEKKLVEEEVKMEEKAKAPKRIVMPRREVDINGRHLVIQELIVPRAPAAPIRWEDIHRADLLPDDPIPVALP